LDSTADGIVVVDGGGGGRIVSLNRRFPELLRLPDSIPLGRDDGAVRSFFRDQLIERKDF